MPVLRVVRGFAARENHDQVILQMNTWRCENTNKEGAHANTTCRQCQLPSGRLNLSTPLLLAAVHV